MQPSIPAASQQRGGREVRAGYDRGHVPGRGPHRDRCGADGRSSGLLRVPLVPPQRP